MVERPSRFSGLRAFLIGGAVIGVLLLVLDPVMRQQDCPNYGANGNASAFRDPMWELYLPALTFVWWVVVIVEQMLPVTQRGRSGAGNAVRALAAVILSTVVMCCVVFPLLVVCH